MASKQSRKIRGKSSYPVAASTTINPGMMVMLDAGYAKEAVASATNDGVHGVATELADNSSGSAGDISVEVEEGEFLFTATSITAAMVGDVVYASDGTTFDETQGSNEPQAGKLMEYVSATSGWVRISPELAS